MKSGADSTAASELARASRLERMANELMIEAKEIRSAYAQPRRASKPVDLMALVKAQGDRR